MNATYIDGDLFLVLFDEGEFVIEREDGKRYFQGSYDECVDRLQLMYYDWIESNL